MTRVIILPHGLTPEERALRIRKRKPLQKGAERHRATHRNPIRCAVCGLKYTHGYVFSVTLKRGQEWHCFDCFYRYPERHDATML
jgi:hypothetical protein